MNEVGIIFEGDNGTRENQNMIDTIKSNLKSSLFKRIIRKVVNVPNKFLL